jgi:hypothetical protein
MLGFLATSDWRALADDLAIFLRASGLAGAAKTGIKSLSPSKIKTSKNNGLKCSKSTRWRK